MSGILRVSLVFNANLVSFGPSKMKLVSSLPSCPPPPPPLPNKFEANQSLSISWKETFCETAEVGREKRTISPEFDSLARKTTRQLVYFSVVTGRAHWTRENWGELLAPWLSGHVYCSLNEVGYQSFCGLCTLCFWHLLHSGFNIKNAKRSPKKAKSRLNSPFHLFGA